MDGFRRSNRSGCRESSTTFATSGPTSICKGPGLPDRFVSNKCCLGTARLRPAFESSVAHVHLGRKGRRTSLRVATWPTVDRDLKLSSSQPPKELPEFA